MDSLINLIQAYPFNLFVYSGIVIAAVALGSLALRRLGRWWRGRREAERKQRTAVEQFQDECRAEDMRDYYGWYFKQGGWGDAPERAGKRAEERHYLQAEFDQWTDVVVSCPNCGYKFPNADAIGVKMLCNGEVFECGVCEPGRSRLEAIRKPPAPSDGDLPPYGSRVPEDAKPVRREEYENDIRAQDAMNESLSVRLAALESARAGEGVRAWVDQWNPGSTLLSVDGLMYRRNSRGQWHPSWIEEWMCVEKLPRLSHAEALRLDAERRGQAPIDWQFKGGSIATVSG